MPLAGLTVMSTSGMDLTRNGYVNTAGIRHPSLHWPSVQMVPCWPLRPLTCTNRVSRRQVATWRMPSTSGKCKSTKWNPNKRSMPGFLLFKFASFPPRSGCVKLLSLLFFTHHHLLNSIQVLSISPSHTLCTSALQLVSCFHPLLFPHSFSLSLSIQAIVIYLLVSISIENWIKLLEPSCLIQPSFRYILFCFHFSIKIFIQQSSGDDEKARVLISFRSY